MKMSRPDMTGSLAHKFSSKYNPSATIFARFTGVLLVRAIPARVGTPASCFPCDDCSWSVPPPLLSHRHVKLQQHSGDYSRLDY